MSAPGQDGYWLVNVDRETGRVTSNFYADADEAWLRSLELETPATFTTVVPRRHGRKS